MAGATIKPPVLIGSGTTIEAGCTLGPNTIVGHNCYIASGTTLSNSLVMNNVKIGASCHLDATIVADGSMIGEGCITLTQRANGEAILSAVKGQLYDTGCTRLGAVIGADTQIGAGCMVGDMQQYGRVYIGTNGRGIYVGGVTKWRR
jgi:NDP-sugar pyrophosphorylase family protein